MTTEKNESNQSEVVKAGIPKNVDIKKFWINYGQNTINDTHKILDERAKYLITTCTGLIVIHFGILVAFNAEGLSIKIAPEAFFIIATFFSQFHSFL